MENLTGTVPVVSGNGKKEELISFLDEKMEQGYYDSALMAILHKAQEIYGYISNEAIEEISVRLGMPTARI
ncbi:MAG: hypothetical protein FJW66_01985, partial [Actinobacteria bacterium]|nr:hypothetical protein [Actinomycetota bacterium]